MKKKQTEIGSQEIYFYVCLHCDFFHGYFNEKPTGEDEVCGQCGKINKFK
jgi:hypothetical protein